MIPADFHASARGVAPRRAGFVPHLLLACVVCALSVNGCSNAATQTAAPVVLGMSDKLTPFYMDENTTLYEVQVPVPLPIRKPTATDLAALTGKDPPYPRPPYLLDSDEQIEIHYTITNLDAGSHVVELLIDPWNEFVRYRPGITVVSDDETLPNLSGIDEYFVVNGMSRLTGTITQDDTNDLAVKLATVENIMAQPGADMSGIVTDGAESTDMSDTTQLINHVFNIQNRTNTGDPLFTKYIPSVIAGLTGWDLGLRTGEPANIAIEISMDLTDLNGNRIVQPGQTTATLAMPTTIITPPGAVQ
jgi:hypothetical protein